MKNNQAYDIGYMAGLSAKWFRDNQGIPAVYYFPAHIFCEPATCSDDYEQGWHDAVNGHEAGNIFARSVKVTISDQA